MAEFVETLRNWRRLCKGQDNLYHEDMCEHCPLYEATHERGCAAIYEDDAGEMDYAEAERVVTDWAAEHPEPEYPTWEMYLAERMTADMRDGKTHNPQSVEEYMRETRIPADIARKLGIEPKEG